MTSNAASRRARSFINERLLARGLISAGMGVRSPLHPGGRKPGRPSNGACVSVLESYSSSGSLQCALLELSSAERRLIRQLFWKKIPKHKVATNLKISQTGGEQHASGKSFTTCAGDCWMSESLLCSQPRRFGAQRLSQLNRRPRISAGLCH